MNDDNQYQTTSNNTAQATPADDGGTSNGAGDDLDKILDVADALEDEGDQISEIIAQTGDEYQSMVNEDEAAINESLAELEAASDQADKDDEAQAVEDARQNVQSM